MRGYLRSIAPKCGPCLRAQEMMIPRAAQNRQHYGFVGPAEPYDCGQCISRHAEEFGFPPLPESGVEAWNLYLRFQDQQRIGMDVIGLDYAVLPLAFELYDIPVGERRRVFESIVIINQVITDERARKRELEALKRAPHPA